MLNPQIILIALVALLGTGGLGFYSGHNWASTRYEAQRAKDQDAYQKQMDKQRKFADELSSALAVAEGRVITRTVEVIKHVPSVTTGTTPCLGPAAIGLLQPGSHQGIRPPASDSAAEDAGAFAASDRDVAYWIAQANQSYEACAVRLNTLVDFERLTNPVPLQSDGL